MIADRCIYCQSVVEYPPEASYVNCPRCGKEILKTEFKSERDKLIRIEDELRQAKEALAVAETEKTQADQRLFHALEDLDCLKEGQQDTLSQLLRAMTQGQENAGGKLRALQSISEKILQGQASLLQKLTMQQQIVGMIEELQMAQDEKTLLEEKFVLWSQSAHREDLDRLEVLKSSTRKLLAGQEKAQKNLAELQSKADEALKTLNAFQAEYHEDKITFRENLFKQAEDYQFDRKYEQAEETYRRLIVAGEQSAEIYWRVLLCHYGVQYRKSGKDEKYVPTLLQPDLTDPNEMSDRKNLFARCKTDEEREHYTKELEQIDNVLKAYRLHRNDANFDVFISVKQKDGGNDTSDSKKAARLFYKLKEWGLKAFNSDPAFTPPPAGELYEPYIISAILSSRVMIVVGTKKEYMEADWVRDEWSRFTWLKKHEERTLGQSKRLLFCYLADGMQPEAIPEGLDWNAQHVIEGPNVESVLRENLKSVFPEVFSISPVSFHLPSSVQSPLAEETLDDIISQMENWLAIEEYERVTDKYKKLTEHPDAKILSSVRVPLLALCAQLKIGFIDDLPNTEIDLSTNNLFKLAMKRSAYFEHDKNWIENLLNNNQVHRRREIPQIPESKSDTDSYTQNISFSKDVKTVNDSLKGGRKKQIKKEAHLEQKESKSSNANNSNTKNAKNNSKTNRSIQFVSSKCPNCNFEFTYDISLPFTQCPNCLKTIDTRIIKHSPIWCVLSEEPENTNWDQPALNRQKAFQGDPNAAFLWAQFLKNHAPDGDKHEFPEEYSFWLKRAADHGHKLAQIRLERSNINSPSHGLATYNVLEGRRERNEELKKTSDEETSVTPHEVEILKSLITHKSILEVQWEKANAYKEKALEGDAEAQYQYALCLLYGRGVAPNESEYRKWLTLAAQKGHGQAKSRLEKLDLFDLISIEEEHMEKNRKDKLCSLKAEEERKKSEKEYISKQEQNIKKAEKYNEADYEYILNGDGTVTITKYKGVSEYINIPKSIQGKKVTCIWRYCVSYDSKKVLKSVNISDGVVFIGKEAFDGCKNLTKVSIPNSVRYIEGGAFAYCENLTDIIISDSHTAFCLENGVLFNSTKQQLILYPAGKSDTVYSIPAGVIQIERYAFSCSSHLTDISIPDSVTSIGEGTFGGCENLSSIQIPEGVKTIEQFTFSRCKWLTNVTIPNSVTIIEMCSFNDCENLVKLNIPNKVTMIGFEAFYGCKKIQSVNLPDSVNSIDSGAFGNCMCLESIQTSEQHKVFYTENGVLYHKQKKTLVCYPAGKRSTNFLIPNSIVDIESMAFDGCVHLKNVTIPTSITKIGHWSFQNCSSLTYISIPNSVTSIGDSAFGRCEKLSALTLPESITNIERGAFIRCSNLKQLSIPKGVTRIESYTFAGCSGLKVVIPNNVVFISDDAFEMCEELTLYGTPDSFAEKYAQGKGIQFYNKIAFFNKEEWERKGLCPYCGGQYNFLKKCKSCGRKKKF